MTTLRTLAQRLTQYDEQEARSIVRLLLSDCFGISFTDICCGALDKLTAEQSATLDSAMKRLEQGEPVQYVTGKAEFYGRTYHVADGVLIPRPETETLIDAVVHDNAAKQRHAPRILDIGTGSGCIAITLAKEIPMADVAAWDISTQALTIARGNAELLGASVAFREQDMLDWRNTPEAKTGCYDIIVSNPPYICQREAEEMEAHVLEHEPHTALFVPNEEPLLFYKSITEFASNALRENGVLAFEINPLYAKEMVALLEEHRFINIQIHKDIYEKERVVTACADSALSGRM